MKKKDHHKFGHWRHSLSSKLVLLITMLIVAISIAVFFIAPGRLLHEQLKMAYKKGRSISNMAAYNVRALLDFGFTEGIEEAFQVTQQNKDVEYLVLKDDQGRVVYSYHMSRALGCDYMDAQYEGRVANHGTILLLVTPIYKGSRELGMLYTGISLKAMRDEVGALQRYIALMCFFIICTGVLGGIFISRIVTAPLKKIAQAFNEISKGDLRQRVIVNGRDETGQLAESFNTMVNSLEAAYRELENSNNTLQAEITERQKTSEVLRESEERYRVLVSALPDFIVVHKAGVIVFVNNIVKELLGYTPDEVVGRNIFEFISPETRPAVEENFRKRLNNENVSSYEIELVKSSGEKLIVETRGTLIKYGEETLFLNVLTNITERKAFEKALQTANEELEMRVSERTSELIDAIEQLQKQIQERKLAEESLRESEEKFKALAEYSTDGIMRFDRQHRHLYVNKAVESSTGIPTKEFLGKTHAEVGFTPELVRLFDEAIDSVFETKQPQRLEFELQNHQWIDWSLAPEFCKDGSVSSVLTSARDITDRKLNEQEIIKAKEQALDASKMKSEFLANMSHEIRTPLNGIIGMTNLLLSTQLKGEQWEFVQIIQNSGDVLLNIINDILDFSKIEAGKLELEIISFSIRSVVEEAVEIFAHKANEKKIELLSVVYDDVPLKLMGDPGRLRQILINLIGNAIKFTDSGEVVVQARLGRQLDHSYDIAISVNDTGIGIKPEVQERLFRPFTQADGSTTRKYGGTGLGLSISKRLVEMMNGDIAIESRPGEGSRFSFTARFGRADEPAELMPRQAGTLSGYRVLIVDDNRTNRKIIQHQTTVFGMRSSSADSAKAALEILYRSVIENDPFHIVIIDMVMPEVDGLELAHRIRSDADLQDTNIVMLTSVAEVNKDTLKEYGINGYINKPVKQSSLFDTIANCLGVATLVADTTGSKLRFGQERIERLENLRILVAEDNTTNQKVAVHMLKKLGARNVDIAANGQEAVSLLRQLSFDIVFMDCQMPEMDGYEATRTIRSFQPAAKRSHIIAMTANALQGDREKCFAAGMDDYISKPVNPRMLENVIQRYFDRLDGKTVDLSSEEEVFRNPAADNKETAASPVPRDMHANEVNANEVHANEVQQNEVPLHGDSAGVPAAEPQSAEPQSSELQSAQLQYAESGVQLIELSQIELLKGLGGDDDPELINEFIGTFLEDTPANLTAIRKAIEASDAPELKAAAHKLKGASGNIGASCMQSICLELEQKGRAKNFEGTRELFTKLEQVYGHTRTELMKHMVN